MLTPYPTLEARLYQIFVSMPAKVSLELEGSTNSGYRMKYVTR